MRNDVIMQGHVIHTLGHMICKCGHVTNTHGHNIMIQAYR